MHRNQKPSKRRGDRQAQAVGTTREHLLSTVGSAGISLIEAAPDAMVIVDTAGQIVVANAQAERMFGYSKEELIGLLVESLVPERLHGVHKAHRAKFSADPRTREMGVGLDLFARRRDGSEFPVEISLSPLDVEWGASVLVAVRDVTERKRSEQLFRGLLESAPDAVVIVDGEGKIVLTNAQAVRLFGYAREDLVGSSIDMLVPNRLRGMHRVHRAGFMLDPRTRAMGMDLALFAFRKDGSEIPVEISLSPLETASGTLVSAAVRDVTERRRMQEEAENARREAERASHSKNDFLSRMSHELRTPLNAILGFGQLLELEQLSAQEDESLTQIMKAGRHLLDLIDEILDISKIEAGRLDVSTEPVSVQIAVSEAFELMGPFAAERSISFISHWPMGEIHVAADRQRLRQVLLNLLSNGIKYNRPGGTVTVSCIDRGDGRAVITVADTGIGIPEEFFDRIFQPFERLGAESSDVQGTGLGLALSSGLIQAMSGALTAESKVGFGTVFRIDLPSVEGPCLSSDQEGEQSAPSAVEGDRSATVLYIEDNLSNLRLIERVLELRPGVRLLSALHAGLGLEIAKQHRLDMVLLDLHLPDMSGEEALWRLQSDPNTAGVPVVIVSADATVGKVQKLVAAGAAAYLTKPLDVSKLLGLIDELLDR